MAHEERLRVGIVGAGGNTRLRHIPGFRAIPGVEITVVCNRSKESSERAAAEFGIPRVAGHWKEVVTADDVDAVMIGTWPYLHAEVTIAALDQGKHVLTEARMARDLREAKAMLEASRRHPALVAQIVPAPMSLDLDATILSLISAGRIGVLREACVTHTTGMYALESAPITWRQDRELSGCNMMTLGIYYEMLRRWVQEDPAWVRADGTIFTRQRSRPEGGAAEVGIPESVTFTGRYSGGARLVGHFSGVEPGNGRNEIRLNGSAGGLRVDLGGQRLFCAPAGGREEPVEVPAETRRGWRVETDFVESIRTGAPVKLTDFESGLAYMRLTEAVFRSWEQEGGRLEL